MENVNRHMRAVGTGRAPITKLLDGTCRRFPCVERLVPIHGNDGLRGVFVGCATETIGTHGM